MENAVTRSVSKHGPLLKIFLCGFLGLLLLIPASMVSDLVMDRSALKDAATREIASKWGSNTTIAGPVLSIPYNVGWYMPTSYSGALPYPIQWGKTHYLHVLPSDLSYETAIDPSIRNRGIYDVVVYRSVNAVKGSYDLDEIRKLFDKRGVPDLGHAIVTMGFSDSKGVESVGNFKFGNRETAFVPGSAVRWVLKNGTSTVVDLSEFSGSVRFSTDLSIRGSEWIKFLPLGKSTSVKTTSSWPNPSFDGAFLPTTRKVEENGFSAEWKILDYNRDFPQYWDDDAYSLSYVSAGVAYSGRDPWDNFGNVRMESAKYAGSADTSMQNPSINLGDSAFGVSLKQGVDSYDKTSRTVNYAILIIGLTFVSFFLMEVLHKLRIHPIQYLLVGFALVVFYTLTLSLSEHLSFEAAYVISALMTAWLITGYVAMAFRSKTLTLTIASILSILYAFIYVILSSDDYALLLGSFGIFIVLALLMYATRNVDWYAIGEKQDK